MHSRTNFPTIAPGDSAAGQTARIQAAVNAVHSAEGNTVVLTPGSLSKFS